jgi:hypothetical protein
MYKGVRSIMPIIRESHKGVRSIVPTISSHLRSSCPLRDENRPRVQGNWEVLKLKAIRFHCRRNNAFGKVMCATSKPTGTDKPFNFVLGVAVRKLNSRRWSGVPVEGCIAV